jgi:hypothetical protein
MPAEKLVKRAKELINTNRKAFAMQSYRSEWTRWAEARFTPPAGASTLEQSNQSAGAEIWL